MTKLVENGPVTTPVPVQVPSLASACCSQHPVASPHRGARSSPISLPRTVCYPCATQVSCGRPFACATSWLCSRVLWPVAGGTTVKQLADNPTHVVRFRGQPTQPLAGCKSAQFFTMSLHVLVLQVAEERLSAADVASQLGVEPTLLSVRRAACPWIPVLRSHSHVQHLAFRVMRRTGRGLDSVLGSLAHGVLPTTQAGGHWRLPPALGCTRCRQVGSPPGCPGNKPWSQRSWAKRLASLTPWRPCGEHSERTRGKPGNTVPRQAPPCGSPHEVVPAVAPTASVSAMRRCCGVARVAPCAGHAPHVPWAKPATASRSIKLSVQGHGYWI